MQQFVGNLIKDATGKEVKGTHVTHFTIAEDRSFSRGGEWVKESEIIQCSMWRNPNAEPYLKKGALVLISGYVKAGIYQKDGEPVPIMRMESVDKLVLLSSGKGKDSAKDKNVIPASSTGTPEGLPF